MEGKRKRERECMNDVEGKLERREMMKKGTPTWRKKEDRNGGKKWAMEEEMEGAGER